MAVVLLALGLVAGALPASASHTGRKPAPHTWRAVTHFSKPRFVAKQKVDVRTAGAFWRAWQSISPGEEIDVHGVTFRGEAVFAKRLPGWAEVHFDAGTRFAGTPGSNLPATWINGCRHIRFYGGTLTNPAGGTGITIYDSSYFTWWGFAIHDTANTGLIVQGIHAPNNHLDLEGSISHWGRNLALDPHSEKGTGLHGANLGDAVYGVKNSRFVLSLHDAAIGSGVEAGGARSSDGFWRNTLYLRCRNLGKRAVRLTAGNCLQVWGYNVFGNDFAYIEAEKLQGRPYEASGMFGGQSLASNRVGYGRAFRTNLNPAVGRIRWDPGNGTVFANIAPRP
ncbi:MAG: hypothetical protein ACJ75G_12050 [Gaiellaceae bacterium]